MMTTTLNLPKHMQAESKLGNEISITGKWIPKTNGILFFKSADSKEMRQEWSDIHKDAKSSKGVLSTEVNHAIGQDAVLVHHVFKSESDLLDYFSNTASSHARALMEVAKPDIHLLRGITISNEVRAALSARVDNLAFGEYLFGYVKNEYKQSDPDKAIQVTAKWTCKEEGQLKELIHWWKMVGTDAYAMEKGLVRFEVYQVIGESALIIHETFETNEELQFHLTKGTAAKYKKEIDEVAFPENYFFRGPVSWMIRTYSKFMHLPATYTRIGHQYFNENGSYSDGLININQNKREMKNQEITVVYQWHANEGKSEDLKRIYEQVEKDMQETEPGALKVNCFFDESKNTLVVEDLFADAAALGQHLGTTAAKHFPSLLQIANPGQFLFCGFVPEEMQQAAIGMGLDAKFATKINGFERVSAEV